MESRETLLKNMLTGLKFNFKINTAHLKPDNFKSIVRNEQN